ncbi:hypothetical protein Q9233_013836 [Columba guinea]|nr:hypothetical protein Q9233_013836 [Columba guinea]
MLTMKARFRRDRDLFLYFLAGRKDNDESETQDSTSTSEEEKDLGKEETAKLQESSHLDSCEGAEETCVASADSRLSTSEQPDYFIKYIAIVSYKQRQSYKDDFNAEYDEYRNLHARMESISRRFMELDAQQKLLTPWSKEYQHAVRHVAYQQSRIFLTLAFPELKVKYIVP